MKLPNLKICGCCGRTHRKIPENRKVDKVGGLWWNCKCHSTLVYFSPEAKAKYQNLKPIDLRISL